MDIAHIKRKEQMNEQMNERLLTDEEIEVISKKSISYGTTFHNIAKAQLARDMGWEDRTASIVQAKATAYYGEKLAEAIERLRTVKDAECQAKIERIIKEVEENSATEKMAYRDGGQIIRTIPDATWQVIKRQRMK